MKYNLSIKEQEGGAIVEGEEKLANSLKVESLTHQQVLAISRFLEAQGMTCLISSFDDEFEKMRYSDLTRTNSPELAGKLDSPKVVTADGVEVCAVMSLEDFYRLAGQAPKGRSPSMMRKDGVMFKEVVLG